MEILLWMVCMFYFFQLGYVYMGVIIQPENFKSKKEFLYWNIPVIPPLVIMIKNFRKIGANS